MTDQNKPQDSHCSLALDTEEKEAYNPEKSRREFLYLTTAGFGAIAVASTVSPLIRQMSPDKSVLALSKLT